MFSLSCIATTHYAIIKEFFFFNLTLFVYCKEQNIMFILPCVAGTQYALCAGAHYAVNEGSAHPNLCSLIYKLNVKDDLEQDFPSEGALLCSVDIYMSNLRQPSWYILDGVTIRGISLCITRILETFSGLLLMVDPAFQYGHCRVAVMVVAPW